MTKSFRFSFGRTPTEPEATPPSGSSTVNLDWLLGLNKNLADGTPDSQRYRDILTNENIRMEELERWCEQARAVEDELHRRAFQDIVNAMALKLGCRVDFGQYDKTQGAPFFFDGLWHFAGGVSLGVNVFPDLVDTYDFDGLKHAIDAFFKSYQVPPENFGCLFVFSRGCSKRLENLVSNSLLQNRMRFIGLDVMLEVSAMRSHGLLADEELARLFRPVRQLYVTEVLSFVDGFFSGSTREAAAPTPAQSYTSPLDSMDFESPAAPPPPPPPPPQAAVETPAPSMRVDSPPPVESTFGQAVTVEETFVEEPFPESPSHDSSFGFGAVLEAPARDEAPPSTFGSRPAGDIPSVEEILDLGSMGETPVTLETQAPGSFDLMGDGSTGDLGLDALRSKAQSGSLDDDVVVLDESDELDDAMMEALPPPPPPPPPSMPSGGDDLATLENVVVNNPHNMPALIELGQGYAQRGDFDRALEYIKRVIAEESDHTEGNLVLGEIYFRRKEYPKAALSLEVVLNKDAKHVGALLKLAQVYIAQEKYSRALKTLNQAQKSSPAPNAQIELQLAKVYYAQENLDQAATHLMNARDIDPNDVDVWVALGHYFLDVKNPSEAKKAFEAGLRLDPTNIKLQTYVNNLQ